MPKINSFIGLVKSHYYDINIINLIPTISIKKKGKKKNIYMFYGDIKKGLETILY